MDEDAPDVRTWAYGYGFSYVNRRRVALEAPPREPPRGPSRMVGRGDDAVGNPHRAQIVQFELFELILLFKLDKQFPVDQFEATISQSTVPCPPLTWGVEAPPTERKLRSRASAARDERSSASVEGFRSPPRETPRSSPSERRSRLEKPRVLRCESWRR